MSRSYSVVPLEGFGGGGVGTGAGIGNSVGIAGTFQEYVGGLRQTGLDVVFVIDSTQSMEWLRAR